MEEGPFDDEQEERDELIIPDEHENNPPHSSPQKTSPTLAHEKTSSRLATPKTSPQRGLALASQSEQKTSTKLAQNLSRISVSQSSGERFQRGQSVPHGPSPHPIYHRNANPFSSTTSRPSWTFTPDQHATLDELDNFERDSLASQRNINTHDTKKISDFLRHVKADFPTLTIGVNTETWRRAVVQFAQLIHATFALRPIPFAKTPIEAHKLFLSEGVPSPIPESLLYETTPDTQPLPSWCHTTTTTTASDKHLSSYAETVLNNDLKSTRVWIGIDKDTRKPTIESDIESQKRTVLFQPMLKSMSNYKLLTKSVVPDDCFSLFNIVVKTAEPEPRAVLVAACNRLVSCKKDNTISFTQWHSEMETTYEQLATVGLDVTKIPNDLFRLGFSLASVSFDKRYETTLESCKDKELS